MAAGNTAKTWLLGAALAVATVAACVALHVGVRLTLLGACVAAYLPSYLDGSEYTGERQWPWFAAHVKRYMASIPATIEYEEPIDASKQHIFCSHPHGLLSAHHGMLMSGSSVPGCLSTCLTCYFMMRLPIWTAFSEAIPYPTRRHLAATVCFRIPLYREYVLWSGCVDARRSIAEKMLRSGKSLVILVGGIAEQMLSQRGEHTIYAKKRKGHIRLALKYGVPIVPGYAFGETDLFTHSRSLAKRFSVAILLGYGSSKWLPLVPHEGVTINQVFGKPIPVEKKLDPSAEDIEKLHEQYVRGLEGIFNQYKERYGYKEHTLHVC
ncbi:hypothetical protein BBJ28_00016366 [Nothophytophthora sp. Chile5]|nr:hypothetical protein BBJ28_00016366 [Nothophytophthora sp. Chile5]